MLTQLGYAVSPLIIILPLFTIERNTEMTTYPIAVKVQAEPQGVAHSFNIEEGNTEGEGFEYISMWLKSQEAKETTFSCPCGAIMEIPDGSLGAHLKNYREEHAGKDAIVRPVYIHEGPLPNPPKPSNTDRTKIRSIREQVQMEENSKQSTDNN